MRRLLMNHNVEIFFPEARLRALKKSNDDIGIIGRIIAIKRNIYTGQTTKIHGVNIVTNSGDLYYAQKAMGETPTYNFINGSGGLHLGTSAAATSKTQTDVQTENTAGRHTIKSTYPKTADADSDNTGSGTDIATWTYEYLSTEGNIVNIAEGAIVLVLAGAGTQALTRFLFGALFTKTSADTLKVIVNHQFNGV